MNESNINVDKILSGRNKTSQPVLTQEQITQLNKLYSETMKLFNNTPDAIQPHPDCINVMADNFETAQKTLNKECNYGIQREFEMLQAKQVCDAHNERYCEASSKEAMSIAHDVIKKTPGKRLISMAPTVAEKTKESLSRSKLNACKCGAKCYQKNCTNSGGCTCSESRLFLDVAKDLKVSPAKLYNLLHKERVLFRLRGQVRNSEEQKHYGFAVTYADFTGTNLFERETVADANGFISSRLRVLPRGVTFIKALISNAAPDAKEIYQTVFPGETI